ncbi:hypothetical protein WDU94_010623 [Cyamophila willieti]
MTSQRTFVSLSIILFAAVLIFAESQKPYTSINEQIKKSLLPFDMLYRVGIVRDILDEKIMKILREDHAKHATNHTEPFYESHQARQYLRKDKSFPKRVVEEVMKDSLFLGTNESMIKMKDEIKSNYNNGTLTDVQVDTVFTKIVTKLKKKTQNEAKKYLNKLVNKDLENIVKHNFKPFNMCYGVGIVRDILEKIINSTLHEEHPTNDTIVSNWSHHVKSLGNNVRLQEKILDIFMKDELFLGTNKSRIELKNVIKQDFKNGTLTDDDLDKVMTKLINKLREKTTKHLNKYIKEHKNKN